ncbi:MAG TPA: XRE family transcriptional regulator [Pseudonocardiaceae bacterium]|nr:XRE family transcriptional regulator [Pseudonocardiaceae bacterium]
MAEVLVGSSSGMSLADKINRLFDQIRKPNGKPYSSAEVAAWCENRTGESFSRAYMSYLRKGQRTNPTHQHLAALAAFFDVSPAYFFDDAQSEQISAQIDLALALRRGDIRAVALRDLAEELNRTANRMSVSDLQLVTDMVRAIGARKAATDDQSADQA